MNASPNLTFKQQRFIEEYQVHGSGLQAVLQLILKVAVICKVFENLWPG